MDEKAKPRYIDLLRKTAAKVPESMGLRLPLVEIEGDREVFIQRHRGILEYTDMRVLVLSAGKIIEVQGESLRLTSMTDDILRIKGEIAGVRLLEE